VFYSPWIGPLLAPGSELPPGGAETQILMLSRALAARGHVTGVITYAIDGALPSHLDGVRIIQQRRPRLRTRFVRTMDYAQSLLASLASVDTGVVVQRAAGVETGLIALLCRAAGRRFIYSSANVVDFSFERRERSRRNLRLFELGVRLADEVIVQSAEQRELCRERFGRDPIVIRSLAELPSAAPTVGDAFLWIGRLTDYKRPLAYVDLARAVPEARFRMVAVPFGDEGERLLAAVRKAMVGLKNLELLAPRPRPQLMGLVARSVAIVNTADYEGMPNIFLEGWARGVPALALNHDPDGVIARELLGEYAAGDFDRMADMARRLWLERGRRDGALERCRAYLGREHAADVAAARWAVALGLEPPRAAHRG